MPRTRTTSSPRTLRAGFSNRRLQRAIFESLETRQLLTAVLSHAPSTPVNSVPPPSNLSSIGPLISVASDHFSVTADPNQTEGQEFQFDVTALNSSNQTDTGFGGTVTFTSTSSAGLPASGTLVNGTGEFPATLFTPGVQTISADSGAAHGTSNDINVAVLATQFVVSAPSAETFGSQFQFTVTAEDDAGNTDTNYNGSVEFNSNDPNAIFPDSEPSLTGGQGTFDAILNTSGRRTIVARDTSNDNGFEGTSDNIFVTSFPLVVTDTADRLDTTMNRTHFTLRDAVSLLNAQTQFTSISFSPTVFPVNNFTTITLNNPLEITQTAAKVTISGANASTVLINGGGANQIFIIDGDVTAAINGVQLTQGFGGGEGGAGGASRTAPSLVIIMATEQITPPTVVVSLSTKLPPNWSLPVPP
jgi:hypothetical protein